MVLLNTVSCTDRDKIIDLACRYLDTNEKSRVLTDNSYIFNRLCKIYKEREMILCDNLVGLWLAMRSDDILLLNNVENVTNSIYKDLINSYNVISIDCCEEGV